MSDDDEEEEVVQEDQPTTTIGWTTKIWYKLGCESSILHHRLMGILQTYYADWDATMEYVCEEQHTIWRTLIGRLGHASPSRMKRRKHIS